MINREFKFMKRMRYRAESWLNSNGSRQQLIHSTEEGKQKRPNLFVLESSAADIALELFDDKLLLGDDRLDKIADGNHTTYFASFDNWQMADP